MKKIFFAFLIFMVTSICYAEVPELVIQNGHTLVVLSIDLTPDGEYLASGGKDEIIKIWEVRTGKLVRNLRGHVDDIISVNFSPDGRYLASSSEDKTVIIWKVSTGRAIWNLEAHSKDVRLVNFSPDGRYLVTKSEDYIDKKYTRLVVATKLWEVSTGRLIKTFEETVFGFSHEGKYLIFENGKFWDIRKKKFVNKLNTKDIKKLIAYSLNGKYIVSYNNDKTIKIYNTKTGKLVRVVENYNGKPSRGKFSPDTKYLALENRGDKIIRLWEVSTGKLIRKFEGHNEYAEIPSTFHCSAEFSPDGKYLITACLFQRHFFGKNGKEYVEREAKRIIRVWEIETGKLIGFTSFDGHLEYIARTNLKITCNGKYFVLALAENIHIFETKSCSRVRVLKGHANNIKTIEFCFYPDGEFLLSGSFDKIIRLWDIKTGQLVGMIENHSQVTNSIKISPDKKYIASSSNDQQDFKLKGAIKLWDVNTSEERTFEENGVGVISIAFNHDGKYLASGNTDAIIRLWEVNTGKLIRKFDGSDKMTIDLFGSVELSPDGKYLASANTKGNIKLFETDTGKLIKTFQLDLARPKNIGVLTTRYPPVVFSPDGKYIVSVDLVGDNEIRFWEVNTGKLIRKFEGHYAEISPNGKYLASTGYDNTINISKIETGENIKTLKGHTCFVTCLKFSSDGKYIASGSHDATIKLWDFMTGKLLATMLATKEGEWITYTPEGYYDCSPGGNKYVSWRVGNKVYSFEQYEDIYHSPEIIKKQLKL